MNKIAYFLVKNHVRLINSIFLSFFLLLHNFFCHAFCFHMKPPSNEPLNLQELPMHQRRDAVSSMVYEANARVRDPVYGCVGAISSLQQQIDALQTQLALAQAEVVHLRVRQTTCLSNPGVGPNSPTNSGSPSSKIMDSQAKPIFDMDMVVDQASYGDSMWS